MTSKTVKVDYSLRPAKQVERKLMLEKLNLLREFGYQISKYRYVGFGSIFYVDFILFHKFLGICDMICFEKELILDRMEYNKPYDFISIENNDFSTHYHTINYDKKLLLWLDYEETLSEDRVNDISDIVHNKIIPGSIIIVTLHAHLPVDDKTKAKEKYIDNFLGLFEKYSHKTIKHKNSITRKNLPEIFFHLLVSKINEALYRRGDLSYVNLFNYQYKDGANMMTVGFLFDDEKKLKQIPKTILNDSRSIKLPIVTNREKGFLDSNLDKLQAGSLTCPFEISKDDMDRYYDFYKEYPTFSEIVL